MVFNSALFTCFFVIIFLLYWFVFNKTLKLQNAFLLICSYVFYGWSDWRLLSFLIVVSILNFFLGIHIEKTEDKPRLRKLLVAIGLIQGIGGLAFFKYYNFFISSINDSLGSLNIHWNLSTLNIIVPLGISFFTFRTLSYILDIDKGKIQATTDWVVFFTYVAFFPSLLSGPIDKAKTFVPQLEKKRDFDYSKIVDGLRQILWGLFKKVVIADNCATISAQLFDNYTTLPASSLIVGMFFYTIQIYADFSGYSDMAIGVARLLGFSITKNFDYPFFAQNIAEFWRKWHISLTTWLTEYVFTPLSISFRDYDKLGLIAAIVINFTIIGIWHGANWTYVLFGFLHGCYYIPLIIKGNFNKKQKIAKGQVFPSFQEFRKVIMTFLLVMFTFVIFRSATIHQAFSYYSHLFSASVFSLPVISGVIKVNTLAMSIFIIAMFVVEWLQRENNHGAENIERALSKPLRWTCYYFAIVLIFICATSNQNFIYFQF